MTLELLEHPLGGNKGLRSRCNPRRILSASNKMNKENGSLDISIMRNPLGKWNEDRGDRFTGLQIKPDEWADLFLSVLHVPESIMFRSQSETFEERAYRYEKSFRTHVTGKGYEMLSRISDIYQDSKFLPSEVNQLKDECVALQELTHNSKACSALRKLILGCEEAVKNGSGLVLLSD